jgi:hypothetical protein
MAAGEPARAAIRASIYRNPGDTEKIEKKSPLPGYHVFLRRKLHNNKRILLSPMELKIRWILPLHRNPREMRKTAQICPHNTPDLWKSAYLVLIYGNYGDFSLRGFWGGFGVGTDP